MKAQERFCDSRRVETFLDGRLSAAEQQRLESHLETCATCRKRLESTAAGTDFWAETSTFLREDSLDAESAERRFDQSADFNLAVIEDAVFAGEQLRPDRPEVLRIETYLDPTDDPTCCLTEGSSASC